MWQLKVDLKKVLLRSVETIFQYLHTVCKVFNINRYFVHEQVCA